MKPGYLLALLCMVPLLAQADIYKSVDANGHVTYSSAPLRGGKKVILTPLPDSPAAARSRATPQDFPKVTQETQRGRDDTRRRILEDELRIEMKLFNEATQNLNRAQANSSGAGGDEKRATLNNQVDLHQRNINALKIELSKLK